MRCVCCVCVLCEVCVFVHPFMCLHMMRPPLLLPLPPSAVEVLSWEVEPQVSRRRRSTVDVLRQEEGPGLVVVTHADSARRAPLRRHSARSLLGEAEPPPPPPLPPPPRYRPTLVAIGSSSRLSIHSEV